MSSSRFTSTGRRLIALVGALAVAGTTLTACAASSSVASDGSTQAVLTWATTGQQPNWDPVVTGSTGATIQLTPIFESLFSLNENHEVIPALAEGYEYNEAGDEITITLKPDLTFQDGTPVDAEAVAFNIDRIKTQENSALKGSYNNVESATVVDDLTVRLDLAQPDHQIPYLLAVRGGLLSSKAAVEADPAIFNSSAPVGAGPFKVVELVPDSRIVLEKFDGYWDADNIDIDRIELTFGLDINTVRAGIESGVYNFAQVDAATISSAEKAGFDVLDDVARGWVTTFFSVNVNKAPFDDPAVVEAIRLAVNPDEFVDKIALGVGEPSYQPFPSTHPAYVEALNEDYSYDPDKARRVLEDAGYADGEVTFELNAFTGQDKPAEILQSQLAAVGITTTINVGDYATWAKGYFSKEFSNSLYGYVGRDSHVQALTEHFDAGGVLNLSSPYTSEEFQKALKIVRATPIDSAEYLPALKDAAQAGYENGSTIALYTTPQIWVKDPSVSDPPTIDGLLSWKNVTITPQG